MTLDENTDDTLSQVTAYSPFKQRERQSKTKVTQTPNWFATSDLHFYHRNILQYTERHTVWKTVEEMNEGLINNWNAVVKPEDTVWSLGDFAFAPFDKVYPILKRLNGEHHMILGNHSKDIRNNQRKYLNTGFVKSIQEYAEVTYQGQHIVLFHYSQRVWNRMHRGSWQIHGHSHANLDPATFGKTTDVGTDVPWITGELGYRPFSFAELKRYMDRKDIELFDHHGRKDEHNE